MGNQFGLQDIFKRSFLEMDFLSELTIVNVFIGLGTTLIVALFIYQVYKYSFKGVVYSQSFNISLVVLSLVTALIIMTISSNVVLSLGMVGALSIVRFRAAIKDPKDIVFMFWAIAVGIASGAGLYVISAGGSFFIGIVIVLMSRKKYGIDTYLLIIKYDKEAKKEVLAIINKMKHDLKSKIVANGKIELTIELRNVGDNTTFVDLLSEIEGVDSAVLVKYSGDYAE